MPPYFMVLGSNDPDLSPYGVWTRRSGWQRTWVTDEGGFIWRWDDFRGVYETNNEEALGWL